MAKLASCKISTFWLVSCAYCTCIKSLLKHTYTTILWGYRSNCLSLHVDERWTSLKDKLLQATKQVCGVSSNHPWRKQTWRRNSKVEEAVKEKHRCFKLWKSGGSHAAYKIAKRASNRAVYEAKSEAEKVTLQKIDPKSADIYRLAKQMRCDNQDVMGEKPVKNDAGQLSLDKEAKKAAWKEHYECLLSVEFPWNPEDLSDESLVEGPSELITLEMITRPSARWLLAKQRDRQVLSLRC